MSPLLDPPNGDSSKKKKSTGNILTRTLRVIRKSFERDGWIGWITESPFYTTLQDLRLFIFVLDMLLWAVEDYFGEYFIRDPMARLTRRIWKEPGSHGPLGEFLMREEIWEAKFWVAAWWFGDGVCGVVYSVLRWFTLEESEVGESEDEKLVEEESESRKDEKSIEKDLITDEKSPSKTSKGHEKSKRKRRAPLDWVVNSWPFTILFWLLIARRAWIGIDVARVAWNDEMEAATDAEELSKMDRSIINPYRFPLPSDQEDVLRESEIISTFLLPSCTNSYLSGLRKGRPRGTYTDCTPSR